MSDARVATTIYLAAALFSGRETWFNHTLSSALERRGHVVLLPQRDGFEFATLGEKLHGIVPVETIGDTVQAIIYVLDVGRFLPMSDVVLANLDEPLDDGVIVEMCDARSRGIPVVGFRTDVRTPYGGPASPLGGVHFFPAFQCDVFFRHHMPSRAADESAREWQELLARLDRALALALNTERRASRPPQLVDELAARLFGGLTDLHSEEAMATIAERCGKVQRELTALRPVLLG